MKCDINVSKKFTINTGNYSSIQPSVSITVHDVDVENAQKAHYLLDIITDGLLHKQIKSDSETMHDIKTMGFQEYFDDVNFDEMTNTIRETLKKFNELK